MVAAKAGIGVMVLNAARFLATDIVFLGIVVIGAVAFVFDLIMRENRAGARSVERQGIETRAGASRRTGAPPPGPIQDLRRLRRLRGVLEIPEAIPQLGILGFNGPQRVAASRSARASAFFPSGSGLHGRGEGPHRSPGHAAAVPGLALVHAATAPAPRCAQPAHTIARCASPSDQTGMGEAVVEQARRRPRPLARRRGC